MSDYDKFMRYEDFLALMEEDFCKVRPLLKEINIDYNEYNSKLDSAAEQSNSIYLFLFDSSGFSVKRECEEIKWDAIESRVLSTHSWLNRICKIISLPNLRFPIEFEDMAKDSSIPILSYHKRKDYLGTVLVPDFEIFEQNYYCRETFKDNIVFQNKHDRAIFFGSTTGTNEREDRGCCNTIDNIENDPSIRIAAAKYFITNDKVVFKLPSIVQCDNKETEEHLKSFAFAAPERVNWNDQFNNKFIISVDGNGPTCTRVAVTLLSNSVLLKYNSNWITYYHRALRAYVNYIPISTNEEVDGALVNMQKNYSYYEQVQNRASEDFSLIFKRANVDRYFAAVLNEYYALFFGKNKNYWENRFKLDQVAHLDIDAHFSNKGDYSLWPSQKIIDPSGNFIEGITIYPATGLFDWRNISYQVMFEDGSITEMVLGGHFAGRKNIAAKITGFRMVAIANKNFSLFYTGIFADGTVQKASNGEWLKHELNPIKCIDFNILPSF